MANLGALQNPGLAAFLASRQQATADDNAQIGQASALMQILGAQQQQQQRAQAVQREQALRGALTQLGPNATQEQLAQVAAQFAPAADILKSQTSSLDRKAALEAANLNRDAQREQSRDLQTERLAAQAQLAKQRSEDMRLSQAERNQARMDMIRLAASLRPPRAEPAVTAIDVIENGRVVKKDARTGRVLGISAADTKAQGAYNSDTATLESTQSAMNRLAEESNRMLRHPGLTKATGVMSWAPLVGGLATVPGTDAADFKAGLDTLKSQVGFSVLQAMRDASKTGGALGQVSDRENIMLQNNLAALDRAQSPGEFRAALSRIVKYTDDAKNRLRGAYNMKHREKADQSPAQQPSGGWSIKPIE